jgi:hypothetical protein
VTLVNPRGDAGSRYRRCLVIPVDRYHTSPENQQATPHCLGIAAINSYSIFASFRIGRYRYSTVGAVLEGTTLMAKRTIHMLVDDIDGGEAEETVKFAIDGAQYEIDLSKKNAAKMRDVLAPYVTAGTKVGRSSGAARASGTRGRGSATVDRDQNRAIREWAQSKGIAVSDRGRIKQEIMDRYHAEAGH